MYLILKLSSEGKSAWLPDSTQMCTCAPENAFFVKKFVSCETNYRRIVLITNSIKIWIICHLCEARFYLDYWGGS